MIQNKRYVTNLVILKKKERKKNIYKNKYKNKYIKQK